MQSADERLETCSSEDEEAEDFAVSEGVVTRVSNFVSNRDWRMVEHVWYRWLNFYHDSWPRRFVGFEFGKKTKITEGFCFYLYLDRLWYFIHEWQRHTGAVFRRG